MGLGGVMWWESSVDKPGNSSLVQNVVQILSSQNDTDLENGYNKLSYPDASYNNLQSRMPDSTSLVLRPKGDSQATG
jgi:chitinase